MDLSISKESNANDSNEVYSDILNLINGIFVPTTKPQETEPDTPTAPTAPTHESIYDFDYDSVPTGETPIVPMNLSLSSYGNGYFHNDTSKSIDVKTMLEAKIDILTATEGYPQSAPLVLIVHTHGTESYSKNGAISFYDDGGELARSDNEKENVVAIGSVVAEVLNEKGINTVHCTIMHDKLQYKDAYKRSEETIKEYLKKYPSIKMVIDVHRDSILKSTGELVRPVTEVNGDAAAQLMFVVGGSDSSVYWQQNLALALNLRQTLNEKYNDICRPPYLKTSNYNQDLVPYSILIEAGSSGNSLEEVTVSAKLFAESLSEYFKKI
jgi:stage II sporulation protein P